MATDLSYVLWMYLCGNMPVTEAQRCKVHIEALGSIDIKRTCTGAAALHIDIQYPYFYFDSFQDALDKIHKLFVYINDSRQYLFEARILTALFNGSCSMG